MLRRYEQFLNLVWSKYVPCFNMNLRVSLYDRLVNDHLLVRVTDLDNEGGKAKLKIYVSNYMLPLEVDVESISLSPMDVFIFETPKTGKIHKVTAKLFAGERAQLHDSDTKMIKL